MQACTLGGMAISHTGTSLPHGLSYRVTCELGTPHGKAVGMFLPGFLRCYGDQEEAMRVLTLLGFGSHQSFEAYIYSLIGEEKISRELWERTMNDLLFQPCESQKLSVSDGSGKAERPEVKYQSHHYLIFRNSNGVRPVFLRNMAMKVTRIGKAGSAQRFPAPPSAVLSAEDFGTVDAAGHQIFVDRAAQKTLKQP